MWLTCVRPLNCLSRIWGLCAEDGVYTNLSDLLSYEKIHCSFSEGGSAPGLTLNPCQFITAASPPSGHCWVVYCLRVDFGHRINDRCSSFYFFVCVCTRGPRVLCRDVRWRCSYLNKNRKDAAVCTFYGCIENGPSLLLCRDPVMNLFNSPGRRGALQSFYRDSLPYLLHWENSWWSL